MNPREFSTGLQRALDLHRAGQLDEAAALYTKLRAAFPRNFDAAHLFGTLELQRGRPAEAAAVLAAARKLDPRSAVCAMRLGAAFNALGRFAEAEAVLRSAVALDPELPEGWFHLGRTLEQLGRTADAVAAAQKAVALRTDYAEALDHLGALLSATRGHAEAEKHFRRAVECDPGFARAWSNLGIVLVFLGRLTEAIRCFDRALALEPHLHHAYAGRGLALERCHRIPEAVADYGRALAGDPGDHQARSARLMALHYLAGISREDLFAEHREFGRIAEAAAAPGPVRSGPGPSDADRRLRVGFLSPNLRTHSVAYFLEPLLEGLDPSEFEILLYHDHPRTDAVSERFRNLAGQWRQVAGMPPQALEAVLRQDRLDILVDLAGHTELNRLVLFARRLAPVQATYLGYPDTTGLRSMDYRLVDEITDPAGRADPFCTEQLVRFAPTAWCYAPPQAPEPSPRPSTLGRPVTFGCFNNFAKVTDESLRAWGQILAAIPGSRLLLKGHGLGAPVLQAEVRRRLEAARIDARRVELLERIESQAEHLAAYARMDVALDTFPYHGTTTTCEALWMGVPVVTLAGDRHASRVGVSLLSAIGRPAWVARDWRDYARIAVELVGTPGQLAAESPILRDAMLRSPLMDRAGQATRFGAALRSMWRNRCAGPVPAEACAV